MSEQGQNGNKSRDEKRGEAISTLIAGVIVVGFFYLIRWIWLPPLILLWTFARMFAGDFG